MTRPEPVKLEYCPHCSKSSLFWDQTMQLWRCRKCRYIYTSNELSAYRNKQQSNQPVLDHTTQRTRSHQVFPAPLWLVNILESKRLWKLVICFAIVWWCWTAIKYSGNSIGLALGLSIPILLLYGVKVILRKFLTGYGTLASQRRLSQIFYSIRKLSFLRFVIILATIALLVTTIWSMVAFIYQLPVASSAYLYLLNMLIIIIAQIWLLSWLCGKLKHSRQISSKPKFAVVFWPLFAVAVFCAFVGISPFSDIKGIITTSIQGWQEQIATTEIIEPPKETTIVQPIKPQMTIPQTITIPEPISVPQSNLRDPSWSQLLAFLKADDTDAHSYQYPTFVCADFARMLQNNAYKAGWRCAIVEVQLSGYPDWYNYGIPSNTGHSCNAFNTIDRGLVYIDCTRAAQTSGPANQDNTVDVQVGNAYIPRALFPSAGWYSSSLSMGIVTEIGNPQW